jgi:hypothetical protein
LWEISLIPSSFFTSLAEQLLLQRLIIIHPPPGYAHPHEYLACCFEHMVDAGVGKVFVWFGWLRSV